MKLGITGCGMIVHDLFRFIHDVKGVELIAMASIPAEYEKVKELAKENHVHKTYECYEDMLADKEVEVIYLGVPNHLHYQMCKQALEANKHVICEKPFTSHIKELEKLNKLAQEKHLFLLEAISTQYLPNVLKMRELLNEVGNVKIVSANYSQYSSRYNAFKEGNILPAFDYTKSGGALMDLNIYNIHLMVALFGEPQQVQYQANIERGIDTSGIITLDYGHFKAVLIGAKDCKAPIMTSIQGDQGCLLVTTPANNVSDFKVIKNDNSETLYNEQNEKHRMYFEFVEFVKIIENKDYLKAEEMIKKSLIAMTIATKARESAGVVFSADENL
ncbi:Gfo/Idh/MocA family protein [Candidatus Stoquefichus massiliensis]|uniref:Gfo/Idh/MocA family protein n=1 Tax=Candidatus Stoquefichus massiliensis TaxID=1470350 RepID=UPI000483CCE1|nr:Gfo/Idh/MocA family oxidoreductase [Candidatus Stoquefichus massiliensis]